MTTIQNLPHEVVSDIFIRLLSKQLAQMRSVCKPWNALLTDSSFIKSHLNRSIQNNNDQILLFFGEEFSFEHDPPPFSVRLSRSPHLELELTNFIKLPVMREYKYGHGSVIGSVNGLICFSYGSYYYDFLVHIWNPSLSAMLTLPTSPFPSSKIRFVFGFGFDPKTDDYKVLRVTAFKVGQQTEVYSMRKGFWKLISQKFSLHIKIFLGQNQVCVDHHLLWLGATHSDMKSLGIVGFDLGAETYFVMPLPDSLRHHGLKKLGVLSGKLCVISCAPFDECEVWVMDEFGVSDSWVKLKHHAFPPFRGDITPYEFTSNGEFFFRLDDYDNVDRFGLYDPVAAKTKIFKNVLRYGYARKIVEYVDSLVWVPPPKCESSSCDISQLQIGK